MKEPNKPRTDLQGNTVLKGKEFQPEVIKMSKNYDCFNHKEESKKLSFFRENVRVSWFFTTGNVTIQGKGIPKGQKSFPKCTFKQFISILDNPKDPIEIPEEPKDNPKDQIRIPEEHQHNTKGPIRIPEERQHNTKGPIRIPEEHQHNTKGPIRIPEEHQHNTKDLIRIQEECPRNIKDPIRITEKCMLEIPDNKQNASVKADFQIKNKHTDLEGNLILKGKKFQSEVTRIADNFAFLVNKEESAKLIFKRENVFVTWFFTTGSVRIQGKVNNRSFLKCTKNQFINILENPKDPIIVQTEHMFKVPEKIQNASRISTDKTVSNEKGQFSESNYQSEQLCAINHFNNILTDRREHTKENEVNEVETSTEVTIDVEFKTSLNKFVLDNHNKASKDIIEAEKIEVKNTLKVEEKVHDNEMDYDNCGYEHYYSDFDFDDLDNDSDHLIETNKERSPKFEKSRDAKKFDKQHIDGECDPLKPVNTKAKFDEFEYVRMEKSRTTTNPEVRPKGLKPGQTMFMSKKKIPHINTGSRRNGEVGESHFMMPGQHFKDEKKFIAEHLAGKPKIREDDKVEHNGELWSQRPSQGNQHMVKSDEELFTF